MRDYSLRMSRINEDKKAQGIDLSLYELSLNQTHNQSSGNHHSSKNRVNAALDELNVGNNIMNINEKKKELHDKKRYE